MNGPPVLRGRGTELGLLQRLARRVAAGQGSTLVVVTGEPGIGKTILLDALALHAERNGFSLAVSNSYGRGRPMAFGQLLNALRSGREPILSPEEFAALADLHDRDLWLIDRLERAIDERAAINPVLVALDDAHDLDTGSVLALRVLGERLRKRPVFWVLGAVASGRLDQIAAAAERYGPAVETIDLEPLTADTISEIAADRQGRPAGGAARRLLAEAGGNPGLALLALEGLDSGPPGPSAPSGITAPPQATTIALRRRLAGLPDATRQFLRAAALIGSPVSLPDVAPLLGVPELTLAAAVEEAVHLGFLDDRGAHLAFRHELMRRAFYHDIPPSVRLVMHRSAAAFLTAGDRPVAQVAPHLLATASACDPATIDVLHRTALACDRTAPETAVELIERAYELADPERRAAFAADRVRLLLGAHRYADVMTAESGLDLEAGRALWCLRRFAHLNRRMRSALEADAVTPATRVELRALKAIAEASGFGTSPTREQLDELTLEARRLGNAEAEAALAHARGRLAMREGHYAEAREHLARSAAGTDLRIGRPDIICSIWLDDDEAATRAIAEATAAGDGDEPPLLWARALYGYTTGALEDADRLVTSLLEPEHPAHRGQEYPYWWESTAVAMRVATVTGHTARAQALGGVMRDHVQRHGGSEALGALATFRIWLAYQDHDHKRAARVLTDDIPIGTLFAHRWPPGWMVTVVEILVKAGQIELATAVADDAASLAAQNPGSRTLAGAAAQSAGLLHSDLDALGRAVEILRDANRPLIAAAAAYDHADALLSREGADRGAGVALLEEAWANLNRLGAHGEAARVRRRLRQEGVRLSAPPAPARPASGWAALTEAEHRVALLVADGHSNRATAEQLHLSLNTVGSHLRSIFTKLGVNSRVQLTRAVLDNR